MKVEFGKIESGGFFVTFSEGEDSHKLINKNDDAKEPYLIWELLVGKQSRGGAGFLGKSELPIAECRMLWNELTKHGYEKFSVSDLMEKLKPYMDLFAESIISKEFIMDNYLK